MHALRSTILLVCWLWLAAAPALADPFEVPASADARSAESGDGTRARARLLVHADPESQQGFVGVLFDLDPGWHLYWRNPGDSGLPTQLRWSFGAATVAVGDIAWPVPKAFAEDIDIVTYGYEDRVLLAVPFSHVEGPPLERISVAIDALVCADQCIPATFALERPYPVRLSARAEAETTALFERFATRVPTPAISRGVDVGLTWPDALDEGKRGLGALRIEACGAGCDVRALADAHFYPIAPDTLRVVGQPIQAGGSEAPRVPLTIERFDTVAPSTLSGVLHLVTTSGAELFVELELPLDTARAGPPTQAGGPGLIHALLLGFLGGLLLNLMPCVLPVLAIKIFAIAEMAHRSRRAVWWNAGAYTLGIVLSLLALALTVVALRASGTAVGWGFQLQDPAFVAGIAAVVVVFALNLFGVFEISVDTGRLGQVGLEATGARRSFFDGLLAVTLATPCSAPFLGTAIGFAFASPAPVILSIFVAIGLGLAAPFVAVALVPGWSRFMPKPGAWMLELRRALGFALLATAIWLLWVIGRVAGIGAMTQMLALLLGIAFAAWVFGNLQRTRGSSSVALAATIMIALAGGLDAIDFSQKSEAAQSVTSDTRPYSAEALSETLASGQPAFVYYTADWCLTCKLNERRVLSQPEVRKALATAGLEVFRADWTRRDESIRLELAKLGKAGVPVYALYRPDAPHQPILLPEILSQESFIQSVHETADASLQRDPRRS
jgi:thiol:disulfide interchange protein DsbD